MPWYTEPFLWPQVPSGSPLDICHCLLTFCRCLMLLWMPGCSRGPQMHHIHHLLPSKLSARATKNIVRKRCLTASRELEQPVAVIHYWHRDSEVPRNAVMTWAPYLMDYNQHNVWQYLTTIRAQWWKFYSHRGRILCSKEREYFN